MPAEIKTTKLKIIGPEMTDRRFSQYPNFAIDGVVASTVTDNAVPTIAQMDDIVKGFKRFENMCLALSSVGVSVKVLSDTSSITAVPVTTDIEVSYNPSKLATQVVGADMSTKAVTRVAGITSIQASGAIATREELDVIANIIWGALKEQEYPIGTPQPQKWIGPAIEVVVQPDAADNAVSKKYNAVQLTTKEYVMDGYVSTITINEFV